MSLSNVTKLVSSPNWEPQKQCFIFNNDRTRLTDEENIGRTLWILMYIRFCGQLDSLKKVSIFRSEIVVWHSVFHYFSSVGSQPVGLSLVVSF